MESPHELDHALGELRLVVRGLRPDDLERPSNCEPWTVHLLASHALRNQLFWAGVVTGEPLGSFEDAMGAVPIEGDLAVAADDVAGRASAAWHTPGILEAVHSTPLGEVPGSVVVQFATIDALAHAWDLSASVDRPIDFDPGSIPWISAVFAATCTDGAREHGLIKDPTDPPAGATPTERLMASAGRPIPR